MPPEPGRAGPRGGRVMREHHLRFTAGMPLACQPLRTRIGRRINLRKVELSMILINPVVEPTSCDLGRERWTTRAQRET